MLWDSTMPPMMMPFSAMPPHIGPSAHFGSTADAGVGRQPKQARTRPSAEKPPKPACEVPDEEKTTVVLRELPHSLSRQGLMDYLDANGFLKEYDFVYLPQNFQCRESLGYAFVNFVSNKVALAAFEKLQGYGAGEMSSTKVIEVGWAKPHQGLAANVERY